MIFLKVCGFDSNDEWELFENFNDEIIILYNGMDFIVLNFVFDLKWRVLFYVNNIIILFFILICLNFFCYFILYNVGKLLILMEVFLVFVLFLYFILEFVLVFLRYDFILGIFVML